MLPVSVDCPFLVAPSVFNVSVYCVVFIVLLAFVLCLGYIMLSVSVYCPFLVAPSVLTFLFTVLCLLCCLLSSCILSI
jgi:hypothetical protein